MGRATCRRGGVVGEGELATWRRGGGFSARENLILGVEGGFLGMTGIDDFRESIYIK